MLYFSFDFHYAKKSYSLVKQTKGKVGKNIYSDHAFSLLDFLRINKPFCEVYPWRIIKQRNLLVKEDWVKELRCTISIIDKSKHFA